MKNNKFAFLLAIVFFTILSLSESFAEGVACTQESIDAINKDKKNLAESEAKKMITAVSAYDAISKQYISTCNKQIELGTPTIFSNKINRFASQVLNQEDQVKFLTKSSYNNTGINWDKENPQNDNCKNLKKQAKAAKNKFISQYNSTANYLGFYANDNNVPTECICDEKNKEEIQCATYAAQTLEEKDDENNKCKPFAEYLAEIAGCPLCPIFSIILSTDSRLATLAWDTLAKSLQAVVVTFGAVYMAMETLKAVGSAAGAGLSSYLRSLLAIGLKVYIVYLLLDNSAYIYDLFISPTLKAGLDMGLALLSIGDPGTGSCINSETSTVAGDGKLDASLLGSIYKTIECFGNTSALMPAVGRGLICYGWDNNKSVIPDFEMWFIGVIMYIFGLAIWLVISFYLIDCTIQLGIVCAIIPILIACWPFKITSKYSAKGVTLLMNTFFNYAMMGVIILFGIKIVGFACTDKGGGFQNYVAAMNANDIELLKELSNLDGIEILTLIVCCIFSFKLIGISGNIANKFAQGAGTTMGSNIGGVLASAATAVGKGAGTSAMKVVAKATGLNKLSTNIGSSAKNMAIKGSAAAGKKVGLGRFQPKTSKYNPEQAKKQNNKNNESEKNNNRFKNDNTSISQENTNNQPE